MAICYPCLKYYVDIVQLLSKSYFSTTSNTLFYPRPLKHCDRSPFPESLNGPPPADAQAGPPGFLQYHKFSVAVMLYLSHWIFWCQPILLAQSFWAITLVLRAATFSILLRWTFLQQVLCAFSAANARFVTFPIKLRIWLYFSFSHAGTSMWNSWCAMMKWR